MLIKWWSKWYDYLFLKKCHIYLRSSSKCFFTFLRRAIFTTNRWDLSHIDPYRNIMLNLNRAKTTCIVLWRTTKCVSENTWTLGWGEMNLPQGHGKKELVVTIGEKSLHCINDHVYLCQWSTTLYHYLDPPTIPLKMVKLRNKNG